jgi:hypothetical protein
MKVVRAAETKSVLLRIRLISLYSFGFYKGRVTWVKVIGK